VDDGPSPARPVHTPRKHKLTWRNYIDKNLAGLIGAVSALVAAGTAQAATAGPVALGDALQASSYSDLLKPIPNALALLKAQAETAPGVPDADEPAMVQNVYYHHHHHHHHYRRHYHHHHHHHYRYN